MLRSGAHIDDVVAASGLGRQTVLGLKGAIIRAHKRLNAHSERLNAHSERLEAETERLEAETEPEIPQSSTHVETDVETPLSTRVIESNAQIPQGYVLKPGLSSQEWTELSKKDKASLVGMVGELKAQYQSLQTQMVMGKGNGGDHHATSYADSESAFWVELAKTERVERALRIRDRYTDKSGNVPADIRTVLEALKIGLNLNTPKQGGFSELEVYRAGRVDEQKNLETAVKTSETNLLDIKLEELKQSKELDNRKLDWEQHKWDTDKQDEGKKWDMVKDVLTGPVGDVVKSLGAAGAERMRGKRPPKVTSTVCPQCNGTIFVDEAATTAVCGLCGSVLAKQSSGPPEPSAPEPQPQPQTEQPQESEQPKPSTKPKQKPVSLPTGPGEADF